MHVNSHLISYVDWYHHVSHTSVRGRHVGMPSTQYFSARTTLPQEPQLSGSVSVRVQPVAHFVVPDLHVQLPPEQVDSVPSCWRQLTPQVPQFAGSVLVSTQLAPHAT